MRGYLPRLLLCVVVALLVGGSVVAQTQQSPGFVLNLPTTSGGEISIISSLSTATSSLGPIVVAGNRTSERAGPIDSGAVYTYVPRTNTVAELLSPSPVSLGRFGHNVATDGTTLFVSALGEGKVYVFTFAPQLASQWSLTQVISAEVLGEIVLAGNRVFIGDPGADPFNVQNAGQVHVFDRIGGVWTFTTSIQAPQPLANRYFGYYFALSQNELVIGESTNPPAGCIGRVFRFNATTLQSIDALPAPTGTVGCSLFGTGVRANASTIAVRARDDDGGGFQSGAVFIYERQTSGAFLQVAKFVPLVNAVNTEWGVGDLGDGVMVVTGEQIGQYVPASLLVRSPSGWVLSKRLERPASSQLTFAGRSAIVADTIVTAAASSSQNSLLFFPLDADCNKNGLGDAYEQQVFPGGSPCAIEWRVADGGNGHWYRVSDVCTSWGGAYQSARSQGGELSSITSMAEQDFVRGLSTSPNIWIGLYQDISSAEYSEPSGGWRWTTGEPVSFTYWRAPEEPNNFGGAENVAHLVPASYGGRWSDNSDVACLASAIEWSADCNSDGIVDYGQIARGDLPDSNSNGIPDTCENSVTVPTQYPTIQAAIDATPAGTARTINVLAGTYNQSFSLNGKNVVVRGAAGNTTILNGAGLTTSIATFTGGEPATAGVENLVFRNGIAGRAINPPSYNFTGGGGIFGKDSSAFVRNCRFEDCGADFGAGVYMLRCTVDVGGCVFSSNDATTDGGGMQTYACSGVVKNSTFTGNRCALTYAGSGSAFKGVGVRTAGTTLALQTCTISGNPIPNAGAAVEYFENVKVLPGVLRLIDTDIVSNTVGSGSIDDAGALRILGRQQSCILSAGTTICTNTPRNVVGPYLVEGAATVCDCEGDLSGNGQVDAADLGILLSVWGTSPSNGQGDLNHDGLVSAPDLSALLALWGPCS